MNKSNNFDIYLSGEKLYGDDFSLDEIRKWYEYQKEWYEDFDNKLNYSNREEAVYSYHASNVFHGYRFLKGRTFKNVLGFGSAYGDELLPIIDAIHNVTILEISKNFVSTQIYGKPVKYVVPNIDGSLSFPDNSFDLIVCFGVLHHIPNVSKVLKEIARCLSKDGVALIREPIVSMGDWSKPRKDISNNERGIPVKIFRKIIAESDLKIYSERFSIIKLTGILFKWYKKPVYNSKIIVVIDYILSWLFTWNINYHPANKIQTLRPYTVFYILKR